jgi:hypothetical protein
VIAAHDELTARLNERAGKRLDVRERGCTEAPNPYARRSDANDFYDRRLPRV